MMNDDDVVGVVVSLRKFKIESVSRRRRLLARAHSEAIVRVYPLHITLCN